MAVPIAIVLFAALLLAGGVFAVRALRGLMEGRLGSIEEKLDRRLGELDHKVDRRLDGLDGRLLSTQRSTGETETRITEKLGKVEGAAVQMLARANDLARLEQTLRPPKARGGVGELLLGNLLRDMLPADSYSLQHSFASGERVDAVIRVDRLVPVDSKFPFDNFERLVHASDESDRTVHARAFARDVKGHIDAIASKYIRPAEGTYDFALMYLASEAVYYELVCGSTGRLHEYALQRRVFPVSPTTFHAYLLVITLGLKGLQIEQHAQEVMAYVAQLGKDFERFRGDFDVVGKHIGNAQSKFGEAERRLERLETRLEHAAESPAALEPPAELPRAVDAA